jgi:hypothetical protein
VIGIIWSIGELGDLKIRQSACASRRICYTGSGAKFPKNGEVLIDT